MLRAFRIVALAAVLALVMTPFVAYAQSGAGDEQYQDPFAGQQSAPKHKPASGSGTLSNAPPASAPSTAATRSTPAPRSSGAPTTLPPELARTGVDMRVIVAAGILLLLMGLTLRRWPNGRR